MLPQETGHGGSMFSDREWLFSKVSILLASWKPILIGTVFLTAIGFAATLLLDKPVYMSRMILPLTPDLRALIQAGVIDAPGLAVSGFPAASTLYTVSVSASSPEETEAGAKRALDQIIARSKPSGSQRQLMLKQIELLETSIRTADQASDVLRRGHAADLQLKLTELKTKLAGISAEDAVLPPTKAERVDRGNLRAFAVIFLASAGLMSLLVFLRPLLTGLSRKGPPA